MFCTDLKARSLNEAAFDQLMEVRRLDTPLADAFACNDSYVESEDAEMTEFMAALLTQSGRYDGKIGEFFDTPELTRAVEIYLSLKKDPSVVFSEESSSDGMQFNITSSKNNPATRKKIKEYMTLMSKINVWNELYNLIDAFEKTHRGLKNQQTFACNLKSFENFLIKSYTSALYSILNKYLYRSDIMRQKGLDFIAFYLERTLQKVKPYEGYVIREAHIPQKVWEEHKPNTVVNYKGFTSTSIGKIRLFTANMIIKAKYNGRYIAPLSGAEYEKEVLFPPNTSFKVIYNSCFDNPNQEFILNEKYGCKAIMEEVESL